MNRLGLCSAFSALFVSLAGWVSTPENLHAGQIVDADICVYGATSGGVIAAVEAAHLGQSVVLVSLNNHVGGMTSGGLGWTDYGNRAAIGGLSREFYQRVGQHYGQSETWAFEPHVAEAVFTNWLQEAHVPVYYQRRLASATMDGLRLTALTMDNGDVFRARMFIDTTYEGGSDASRGRVLHLGSRGDEYLRRIAQRRPAQHPATPVRG